MEAAPKSDAIETPLAALHERAGAKMGVWFGCALPDHFGDVAAEYRLARQSVALIDKNYRAYLSFGGPDRTRYLNAILTNNIKELPAGHGNVSLLLNPQGHILAEIETYALGDRLFCVSHAMIRERLIEWMDKYIIMDDVTLTDETQRYGTLALEGPKAASVVNELTGIDLANLDELATVDAEILRFAQDDTRGESRAAFENATEAKTSCRLVKRSPGGVAGAEFVFALESLPRLWDILLGAMRRHGGGAMGYAALSAHRLALGVPWFGYDFGEKQIPHEAGLENNHISYTKGCYTGQEIVERVRSRGQVNRKRAELEFAGETVPPPETVLTFDGKEVGAVTRAARTWDPNRILGMAYLRREAAAPGTRLDWSGGVAKVVEI